MDTIARRRQTHGHEPQHTHHTDTDMNNRESLVIRSEWIKDTASPDWKPITLDCSKLCLGDWTRALRWCKHANQDTGY